MKQNARELFKLIEVLIGTSVLIGSIGFMTYSFVLAVNGIII